jgi:hypothetical protein
MWAGPLRSRPGEAMLPGISRAREGGPVMSVYVGTDVHRKRSQIALLDELGEVRVNRNVPNGTGSV